MGCSSPVGSLPHWAKVTRRRSLFAQIGSVSDGRCAVRAEWLRKPCPGDTTTYKSLFPSSLEAVQPNMKFVFFPLVALFTLLSFSAALPIELQGLRARADFDTRLEEDTTPAILSPLDKRENTLLTSFFTSLNKTNTGVTLAKAAVRTPLVDDQIVKFIANLIEEKNLTNLLEMADDSGLALDLVLLILTHYEVIDGLTDFVKYYKGGSNLTSGSSGGLGGILGGLLGGGSSKNSSSSSGGGLVSGLLGGLLGGGSSGSSGSKNTTSSGSGGGLVSGLLGSLLGGGSSSSSSSPSSSSSGSSGSGGGLVSGLLGNLMGGSSGSGSSGSGTTSAPAAVASATSASPQASSSKSGGLLGGLLGGLGGSKSTGAATTSGAAATSAAPLAGSAAPVAGSAAAESVPVVSDLLGSNAGAATNTPAADTGAAAATGAADTAATAATGAVSEAATAATGAASTSTASGLAGALDNLLKRADDEDITNDAELLRRHTEAFAEELQILVKRSEEASYLEKRDVWDNVYQQMISLIGTDSNVEDVMVSLKKSGLAMNVIYNALTDSDWYGFDKKLVKYLVENDIVTFPILLNALLKSGVIWHVAADIISNSDYVKLVIDFVLAIFTGKVNVTGLIMAFF